MPDRPHIPAAFTDAIEAGDTERVEELWLEALEQRPLPTDQLLEVRRRLWKDGHKNLARTLLDLLADTAESSDDTRSALAALRELVRLADKPETDLLERLERACRRHREHCPSLAAVLDRHQLVESRRPLETLEIIERWLDHDLGTIVEVIGQGVGTVVDANLELENIKVDVGGPKPVSVPFGAIARYVRQLPEGDFRRRSVEDRAALQHEIDDAPGAALVHLLESLGDPVDVAAIKTALEGLVEPGAWNGWWNRARKHPRLLTSGSGSRLKYTVEASAEAADEALLEDLRNAEPRHRLPIARRLLARSPEAGAAAAAVLKESLDHISESDPGLAWETAGVLGSSPAGTEAAARCRSTLIESAQPLELLSGIQDRGEREAAIDAVGSARPQQRADILSDWMLHETHPAVLDRIMSELDRSGGEDMADAALEAIFRNHTQHPAQFLWACEAMVADDAPETLRRRMTPSILEKLPDALSRPEFGPVRGRAKGLLDGGQVAVKVLLESATTAQAERFIGRVARVSTVEPQRMRTLEQAAAQGGAVETTEAPLFVASRSAIDAKRSELKQLTEVDIPKTLKGINAAAAEGDLRENFEYHMLRDRQELQSARAAKLQRDLGRVRVLEPGTADCSQVNIGTVIHLEGADGAPLEAITILGTWDADVHRRIFANGSGVAQAVLGRRVGDDIELQGERATITRIEPWTGES